MIMAIHIFTSQRLWNVVINRLLWTVVFMQGLMVLSAFFFKLPKWVVKSTDCCQSYWTSGRLEDFPMGFHTPSYLRGLRI